MKTIKQIAIIGPTASGKTGASIALAQRANALIVSLDSLSIFKEIDIASAKPTLLERKGIEHFGIDEIYPSEAFDVTHFIKLYQKAYDYALSLQKPLIIVGGSSFYLKMLLDGISQLPTISADTHIKVQIALKDLSKSYQMLHQLDKEYMQPIAPSDRYRIEKALSIYFQTHLTPSHYFAKHPPQSVIAHELPIYSIATDREILKQRIRLRTHTMIEMGLIDEVCYLEQKYTRTPHSMKSIGIKETLDYLDGRYAKDGLTEAIITHTAQLAKRQNTFNRSQFNRTIVVSLEELYRLEV